MKRIFAIRIIGLILSVNLISATGIHDEPHEELSLWGKIVKWFREIFRPNDNDGPKDIKNILKNFEGNVEFYKSMSCGCCGIHSDYLRRQGLDHQIITVDDVSKIKKKYGVPTSLWSCHTIILGDYFVEGHMPKEAIEKLITEKPDIAGIALPGMPSGSPGMPGSKTETWIIYAVNHDGSYGEFMRI